MSKKDSQKLLWRYYRQWTHNFKEGTVSDVTLAKYNSIAKTLEELAPELRLNQLSRSNIQGIMTAYGKTHAKATVKDFYSHLKAALEDANIDGLISRDPTVRIRLTWTRTKRMQTIEARRKFLNKGELSELLDHLDLSDPFAPDWLILLAAKTGMRLAECLGVTPADFDFDKNTVTVNKTWNHKSRDGHFMPTKNEYSIRTIPIDSKLARLMKKRCKDAPKDLPLFVEHPDTNFGIYSVKYDDRLKELCEEIGVVRISFHGLRHTHASILLYEGASVMSVAKRLGHSKIDTTQRFYLHLIEELKEKDEKKILAAMETL